MNISVAQIAALLTTAMQITQARTERELAELWALLTTNARGLTPRQLRQLADDVVREGRDFRPAANVIRQLANRQASRHGTN